MSAGTVYWITGLAGSGKTTIGRKLFDWLKSARKAPAIFLDGDVLRDIFGNDLGYSREERRASAMRNARLCKALSDQGISVICPTISMFHDCQKWNRENMPRYCEIFVDVPMEVLIRRDQNGLYSRSIQGLEKNVVGVDIPAEFPARPDLVLKNDGASSLEELMVPLKEFIEHRVEA